MLSFYDWIKEQPTTNFNLTPHTFHDTGLSYKLPVDHECYSNLYKVITIMMIRPLDDPT